MIVFVRTKAETETLAEQLRARGYSAAAINGDVVAGAARAHRRRSCESGKLDILVATDVAARGLDVERISHVVNFDIPTDTESYVHRIGRTGRAGRSGDAISFVTPRERRLLATIEKATRHPLTPMQLPSVDDVNATRLARFDDSITAALRPAEISQFRDIVAHYVAHHDVPEVDVAAALARRRPGRDPVAAQRQIATSRCRAAIDWPTVASARRAADRPKPRAASGAPRATYRIAVGKRQKVEPRQIVGALANEGGLVARDFGAIAIRPTSRWSSCPPTCRRRGAAPAGDDPHQWQADRAAPGAQQLRPTFRRWCPKNSFCGPALTLVSGRSCAVA